MTTTYRSVINNSQGPNVLYTLNDIVNDVSEFMIVGNGTGALEIFVANINNQKDAYNIPANQTYTISGYGTINLSALLTTIISDTLNTLPLQTNSNLTSSGALNNAIYEILGEFNNILWGPDVYTWEMDQTYNSYKRAKTSTSVKNNTNEGISNNFNELYNTVAAEVNSVISSYNPTCTVFTPITIGNQLGSVYSTANASCASAIQLAGQSGEMAGGTNSDLLGYDDLVTYWTEVNNQWLTVENEQIGTNMLENPDYIAINTNLSSINATCATASAAYQNYITQEMSAAMTPAPIQRPPDTGVTSIINDTITQYYETEMEYLQGLEQQLQGILNYLTALNIPNIDGSTNSTIGSNTVINLNTEGVIFSAPTNPPTGIITIEGNPGQQTLNMILSKGITGQPGIKGPTGHNGVNGAPGKPGQIGQPGIFEIPYQYFQSF